jgi:guanylate cyclase
MRKQAGDIYAFGIVMYEILFRALPFPEGANIVGELSGRLAAGDEEGSARNRKRKGEKINII